MRVLRPLAAVRDRLDDAARNSPARLTLISFALLIAGFTALLSNPRATSDGRRAPFADALFTAASSVSVTGLTTVPTGSYWSRFGQVVILLAIMVGGLGVLTFASLLGLAVSRRIGLTQMLLAATETKGRGLGEVGSLLRVVVVTSLLLEAALAAVLVPRFLALGKSPGEATWQGVFYAISAFNHAGIAPTDDGFLAYTTDWWLSLPVIIGVFVGSLGFPVILGLHQRLRRRLPLTLHAKLTLATSAILIFVGTVAIGALEWNNQATFGRLGFGDKVLASLFAGTMPRAAGFSSVDVGQMEPSSRLVTDGLMFIGGGSASAAGGIKVTTFAVLILAIFAEARGDRDVEAFGRRIPSSSLRVAVGVTVASATLVFVACLVLLEITGWPLDVVFFETVSAFGTSGLSTGVTADLPESGKYVLSALMFIGRTGTMTLAAALALRDRHRLVRYPEERPIIG
jgi:trk system potassium uptake protein TrkH